MIAGFDCISLPLTSVRLSVEGATCDDNSPRKRQSAMPPSTDLRAVSMPTECIVLAFATSLLIQRFCCAPLLYATVRQRCGPFNRASSARSVDFIEPGQPFTMR